MYHTIAIHFICDRASSVVEPRYKVSLNRWTTKSYPYPCNCKERAVFGSFLSFLLCCLRHRLRGIGFAHVFIRAGGSIHQVQKPPFTTIRVIIMPSLQFPVSRVITRFVFAPGLFAGQVSRKHTRARLATLLLVPARPSLSRIACRSYRRRLYSTGMYHQINGHELWLKINEFEKRIWS